ncbi:DEAD/DEAH box helicase [Candidatus Dependentiae bacterium]|nr:MAG: DEAD/DEAH box helicase [Candidatus Dependentiae bacterium]
MNNIELIRQPITLGLDQSQTGKIGADKIASITLSSALKFIKRGVYSGELGTLSHISTVEQIKLGDKSLKKTLPTIWWGVSRLKNNNAGRTDENMVGSGFMFFDIDKIDNIQETKDKLLELLPRYLVAAWTSVSGKGIGGIIKINENINQTEYIALYNQLSKYLADNDIIIDPACKNIGRINYVTYDPTVLINLDNQDLKNYKLTKPLKTEEEEDAEFDALLNEIDEYINDKDKCEKILMCQENDDIDKIIEALANKVANEDYIICNNNYKDRNGNVVSPYEQFIMLCGNTFTYLNGNFDASETVICALMGLGRDRLNNYGLEKVDKYKVRSTLHSLNNNNRRSEYYKQYFYKQAKLAGIRIAKSSYSLNLLEEKLAKQPVKIEEIKEITGYVSTNENIVSIGSQLASNPYLYLQAPTGSGKTDMMLKLALSYIYYDQVQIIVTPSVDAAFEISGKGNVLAEKNGEPSKFEVLVGDANAKQFNNLDIEKLSIRFNDAFDAKSIIVTTSSALKAIMDLREGSMLNSLAKKISKLYIDEAHILISEDFRDKSSDSLLKLIDAMKMINEVTLSNSGEEFKNIILASATPTFFDNILFTDFKVIDYITNYKYTTNLNFNSYEFETAKEAKENCFNFCVEQIKKGRKVILRYNAKSGLKKLKEIFIKDAGLTEDEIYLFSSEDKQDFIKFKAAKCMNRLILTTSAIDTSIDIMDDNVDYVMCEDNVVKISVEQIIQATARLRNPATCTFNTFSKKSEDKVIKDKEGKDKILTIDESINLKKLNAIRNIVKNKEFSDSLLKNKIEHVLKVNDRDSFNSTLFYHTFKEITKLIKFNKQKAIYEINELHLLNIAFKELNNALTLKEKLHLAKTLKNNILLSSKCLDNINESSNFVEEIAAYTAAIKEENQIFIDKVLEKEDMKTVVNQLLENVKSNIIDDDTTINAQTAYHTYIGLAKSNASRPITKWLNTTKILQSRFNLTDRAALLLGRYVELYPHMQVSNGFKYMIGLLEENLFGTAQANQMSLGKIKSKHANSKFILEETNSIINFVKSIIKTTSEKQALIDAYTIPADYVKGKRGKGISLEHGYKYDNNFLAYVITKEQFTTAIYKAIEVAHPTASFDMRKTIYRNWMKYIQILTDFNENFGSFGTKDNRKTLRTITITHLLTREELMEKLYTELYNVINHVSEMCDCEPLDKIFNAEEPKKTDGSIDFNPDLWAKIFEAKGNLVINNG